MKYQQIPELIEAFIWVVDNEVEDKAGKSIEIKDPAWIVEAVKSGRVTIKNALTPQIFMSIDAKKNKRVRNTVALPGQFIIKYDNGDLGCCTQEKFERTYNRCIND